MGGKSSKINKSAEQRLDELEKTVAEQAVHIEDHSAAILHNTGRTSQLEYQAEHQKIVVARIEQTQATVEKAQRDLTFRVDAEFGLRYSARPGTSSS